MPAPKSRPGRADRDQMEPSDRVNLLWLQKDMSIGRSHAVDRCPGAGKHAESMKFHGTPVTLATFKPGLVTVFSYGEQENPADRAPGTFRSRPGRKPAGGPGLPA